MGYTHGTSADAKMRTCTSCDKTFPNTHDYYAYIKDFYSLKEAK